MEKNYLMNDLMFLIPARSGSTRIKNKNLRTLNNQSILVRKIKTCLKTKLGKVLVSTDCKRTAQIAINAGAIVPYLRDKKISHSKATMVSVIIDYLKYCKINKIYIPKYISLVPPTHPFLKMSSLKNSFNEIKKTKFNSIISLFKSMEDPFSLVTSIKKKINFDTLSYKNLNFFSFERSQDKPSFLKLSSSIQITKTKYFNKFLNKNITKITEKPFDSNSCCGYLINQFESFDINSKNDLYLAKRFFKKQSLLRLFAENFF